MVILFVMPKVTEAYREARRDEIARAALRVLERRGVGDTSIAQIVEECGLSAGAIYVSFENKADLARYIASRLLAWRIDEMEQLADDGAVHTPAEVLKYLLAPLDSGKLPLAVIVQFWAEATVEPDLKSVLVQRADALRSAVGHALQPWAERQPGATAGLADQAAATCLILSQGLLVDRCLFRRQTTDEFLDTLAVAFR